MRGFALIYFNIPFLRLMGMISQLSPLDVAVINPFYDYSGKEYEAQLVSENLTLTLPSKVKNAYASKLVKWVSAALEKMAEKTVEQSFKECCTANAPDGTDGDILWGNSDPDCHDLKSDLE
jgi:hypothetical protein